VKRLTRSGRRVHVTDHGKPLWIICPAVHEEEIAERSRAIDEVLDEALRAPRSKISLSDILEKERR
jgi:hypothetical protein